MLIEFGVENFRSIKDEMNLSMVAVTDTSFENHLIKCASLNNEFLLKSVVLYGPNASGKTNILLALNNLKHLVMSTHKNQKGDKLPFNPFKLNKEFLNKPTKFKLVFVHSDIRYLYEVEFNANEIIKECLYEFPNNHKKILFERTNTVKFKFVSNKKKQTIIAERTSVNVLYLSKATQDNYEPLSQIYDWFKDKLRIIGPTGNPVLSEFTTNMLKDESLKKIVLKSLYEADVGIDDIVANVKKIRLEDLPEDMPEDFKKLIMQNKKEILETKLITTHKGIDFDFEEESEGTRRLFSIIGPWIDALQNGKILIVDELDTKLHHLLNVFLINLFHNPTQNKNNAQLIFTTHNTNLLDIQDIFRRDQIWFTEKNPSCGATDLYSLVEFSPRKDKDVERGYLAGKYGALPFIKDINIF